MMSTESLNYVLVKVSERGDLSQLAELESELLKAFPSRNVLWTGGGVPQFFSRSMPSPRASLMSLGL